MVRHHILWLIISQPSFSVSEQALGQDAHEAVCKENTLSCTKYHNAKLLSQ